MYTSNSHSYTHFILALGIVRKPQYGYLLLQNILAYMTLACLRIALLKWVSTGYGVSTGCTHRYTKRLTRHSLYIKSTWCTHRYNTQGFVAVLAWSQFSMVCDAQFTEVRVTRAHILCL